MSASLCLANSRAREHCTYQHEQFFFEQGAPHNAVTQFSFVLLQTRSTHMGDAWALTLTSGRTVCPHCRSPLLQAKAGARGSVQAHVIAEPDSFVTWHLSRACPRACRRATYWCGFVTFFQPQIDKRGRKHKQVDCPNAKYFFLSAPNGIARSWLRRWRYRLYLQRASFQAEATLLRLLQAHVRLRLREQLRQLWAREILCRRAVEAGVNEDFHKQALNGPLEALIAGAWKWCEPLMFSRRGQGFLSSYRFQPCRLQTSPCLKLSCRNPFCIAVGHVPRGQLLLLFAGYACTFCRNLGLDQAHFGNLQWGLALQLTQLASLLLHTCAVFLARFLCNE